MIVLDKSVVVGMLVLFSIIFL